MEAIATTEAVIAKMDKLKEILEGTASGNDEQQGKTNKALQLTEAEILKLPESVKKVFTIKGLPVELSGIMQKIQDLQEEVNNGEFTPVWCSPNKYYRLSKAAARRLPKLFKDELKINGDYQNNRYIVRLHKATLDNGTAEYRIYIKSRRLNTDGKKAEIGGSGATLPEAEKAFIKALQAVKLPPQE